MAHPWHHAESTARRWGGRLEDYLPAHNWMDETKRVFADVRHRALRHHAEGIFLGEQVLGPVVVNSDGRKVPVRIILEQHVREDCSGFIPTASAWLRNIRIEPWMMKKPELEMPETMDAALAVVMS